MRRLIIAIVLGVTLGASTDCLIPIFSADPARRTRQLIYTSESLRHLVEEWERFWFLDHPDQLSPYRTHGGVI